MEEERIEYAVEPVVSYVLMRRYTKKDSRWVRGGQEDVGEYRSAAEAAKVAAVLAKEEMHQRGWPDGDPRMKLPEPPPHD